MKSLSDLVNDSEDYMLQGTCESDPIPVSEVN